MKALYQFAAGETFLHRLDPRSKLLFVLCYLIITFVTPHSWVMPLIIMLILFIFGKMSPLDYYPILVVIIPIMLAITIVQSLVGGPPYTTFWIMRVSIPGFETGVLLAFRLATMGITFVAFSMTTDPFDWGISMYHAKLPYKIAFMFAFAMRFFPLLQEEFVVIRNALNAKGFDTGGLTRPLRLIKGSIASIVPLALSALRRSQYIAQSMELRGFSIPEETGIKRVIFRDVKLRRADYCVMAITLIATGAVIANSIVGFAW